VPTPFLELANLCDRLEKTPKTTEKIRLISTFLSSLEDREIAPAVFLLIGSTFAESDPETLDINWKTLLIKPTSSIQISLTQQPITICSVYSNLVKLGKISGSGARKKKKRLLHAMLRSLSEIERKFLIRNILGEMRHGVGERLVLRAIAKGAGINDALIKRASALYGNLGDLARIAIVEGLTGIKKIKPTPFMPIKPMLAEPIDSIDDLLKMNLNKIALEFKYDGIRAQIHKNKQLVRIFSRQLKDISDIFPEILKSILEHFHKHSFILDGEIVAVSGNNRPLPFQNLMRRFRHLYRRQHMQANIAIRYYAFDLLYLDGQSLLNTPYKTRWNRLSKLLELSDTFPLATRLIASSKAEIREFYQTALNAGHEGIVIKSLDSSYLPNERSKKWLKLKSTIHLDLVIVAADWGSGRRRGWLSNYHLAAFDPQTSTFHIIGKTFKGLTDKEFQEMTDALQKLKIHENGYTIFVKPQIVVEIAFNEIQKSPSYPSGYALRFARVKRIRFDKSPYEITTLQEIASLYNRQFEKKRAFIMSISVDF